MNNERIYEIASIVQAVPSGDKQGTSSTYNGTSSVSASGIDTMGYDGVVIVLNAGTYTGDGASAITVLECETNDFHSATPIVGAAFTSITTTNHQSIQEGFVLQSKSMRYIWVKIVATGSGASPLGSIAILGRGYKMPITGSADLVFCVDGSV